MIPLPTPEEVRKFDSHIHEQKKIQCEYVIGEISKTIFTGVSKEKFHNERDLEYRKINILREYGFSSCPQYNELKVALHGLNIKINVFSGSMYPSIKYNGLRKELDVFH